MKTGISSKNRRPCGSWWIAWFFLYFLRFGYRPSKLFLLAQHAFSGATNTEHTYSDDVIKHWLKTFIRRFFAQQFKRSCLPDGPKVEVSVPVLAGTGGEYHRTPSAIWFERMWRLVRTNIQRNSSLYILQIVAYSVNTSKNKPMIVVQIFKRYFF